MMQFRSSGLSVLAHFLCSRGRGTWKTLSGDDPPVLPPAFAGQYLLQYPQSYRWNERSGGLDCVLSRLCSCIVFGVRMICIMSDIFWLTNSSFRSAFLIRRNADKSGLSDRKLEIWSVGGYFFLFLIFNVSYWATYI